MTDPTYSAAEWARYTGGWVCNVDHGGAPCPGYPDPLTVTTDEEPWPCASEPCTCLPDRSGAVIVWVLAALLVVGVIVWAWSRG